jgi:hypothetical protein
MSYAGYDLATSMQQLTLNSRFEGEIHTSCDVCDTWVEFGVIKGELVSPETYEAHMKRLRFQRTGKTDEELDKEFAENLERVFGKKRKP